MSVEHEVIGAEERKSRNRKRLANLVFAGIISLAAFESYILAYS